MVWLVVMMVVVVVVVGEGGVDCGGIDGRRMSIKDVKTIQRQKSESQLGCIRIKIGN